MKNIKMIGLFLICLMVGISCTSKKSTFVTIGTGGVTGVYYPAGGAVAKMVNKATKQHHIRASVESTGGSVYNINAILSGDLQLGIAQSDRQYQAFHGQANWEQSGPQKNLRSVLSLHREAVTLVAAVDAKIRSLKDLKGKRVNIGNPGSGIRGNAFDVLKTANLDYQKDIRAESVKGAEAPKFLQDNRIDAFFYTVGHPSSVITESSVGRRKVQFVPIVDMESLLSKYPYYDKAVVPSSEYPRVKSKGDVPTIGVVATVVTSSKVSTAVIYAVTKEIFENIEEFKSLHPAFARLTKEGMLKGLSAPLHPGAIKYYKEMGLM